MPERQESRSSKTIGCATLLRYRSAVLRYWSPLPCSVRETGVRWEQNVGGT